MINLHTRKKEVKNYILERRISKLLSYLQNQQQQVTNKTKSQTESSKMSGQTKPFCTDCEYPQLILYFGAFSPEDPIVLIFSYKSFLTKNLKVPPPIV